MDQENKLRRVSFSDLGHGRRVEESTRSRDRTKSKSFRAYNDEGMAKLRKEYDYDYDYDESELAATIAAAAYAIHSLDETRAEYERTMVESFRESFRAPSMEANTTKDQQGMFERVLTRRSSRVATRDGGGEGTMRTSTRPIEVEGPIRRNGKRVETKADAWERARMAKINKWYEKMNCKILEWENEKKKRAGINMERRKAELERLKRVNLNHYQNKIDWIENVSGGARKQLEEKKISEEAYVKQKANTIRSTGKTPIQCFCFEY